jgi:hypothetical protein
VACGYGGGVKPPAYLQARNNDPAWFLAAFNWQQHTVRGAIAGALKKKLGLNIVSQKAEGSERTCRIEG